MRLADGRGSVLLGALALALGSGPPGRAAGPDAKAAASARLAIEPAAPELPAAVVAAMQDGRFAEAEKALDALARDPKASPDDRPYFTVIRGVALRLAGKLDEARALLSAELAARPGGRWAAKVRSELAGVEVAAGRFAAAEALARSEAEALLAGDRKDRLAEVYRGFADRLLRPGLPTVPPDPEGAYALLARARDLAKTGATRASLRLAMARASQEAGNHPRAIEDFEAYLKDHPGGPDRTPARLGLGESRLAAGQALPARLAWADLARDLEKLDTPEAVGARAQALHGVARTHGIPTPPDDAQLGLGVAALRRLLAANPPDPLASRAAFEVGASYLARGKSQDALDAFGAILRGPEPPAGPVEGRGERPGLLMAARFRVGQILQGQGRSDEAIAAYRDYLARHPDGPESADAQRAVLDVQEQAALDLLRREKFAEARAAFLAFAGQNPLDARVPRVLFLVGQAHYREKNYDLAIGAWEALAGKFPGTEEAGHARYATASAFEDEKRDPSAAIERYRSVSVEPWQSRARERVALIEAKALTVVTERASRSGERPRLKVASRNLERLTFAAYRVDPEAYFRKKHALGGVEALDIGLVAPDAEWKVDVPGYARFAPIESTYELGPLEMPGVYVVKVSDEVALQATTMVVGSDVDAIVKTSRDQVLVFAQDMKTGRGRAGARVLVADEGGVILDARAGPDGVLVRDWVEVAPGSDPKPAVATAGGPRAPRGAISYLVIDGGDVAGSGLAIPEKVAQGLSPRAYLYTDRPAYRPGQSVSLRGVVREVVDGQYANLPGATYLLEVFDSRGRKLRGRPLTLSGFGTFAEALPLDPAAPVGTYRVRLSRPGRPEFAGAFEVQAYQLEKVDLALELPQAVYYRGETIKGTVVARYQYGTPLAGRALSLELPDGRTVAARTDAEGKYAFELETAGFGEEQALRLVARLPEDDVSVASTVMLAVRGFRIDLATDRDVYLDGEGFAVRAVTLDARGEPTGQALAVALLKRAEDHGRASEREAGRVEVVTDPRTGRGEARLKVEDEEGGTYIVRASGVDRFRNPVIAERALTISGRKDGAGLRILADRSTFRVGEPAEVRLVNRGPAGTALLTWEADRVLMYRVVPVAEGSTPLAWAVDGKQFPNFTLTASRMAPSAFHEARLDVRVERDLRVTITPKAPVVAPGAEVEVEIRAADQDGKPAAAEVSVALVDRSLLRLFADRMPPIDRFFHDQSRTSAFATGSTSTFRYAPATTPVPGAVVEAAAQDQVRAADVAGLGDARKTAEGFMFFDTTKAADLSEVDDRLARGRSGGRADSADAKAKLSELAGEKREAGLGLGVARDKDADAPAGAPGRPELFAKSMARRGWGEVDGAEPGSPPRERFAETAYWNPSVVTGPDGRATVKFRAPAALSEYRFTARGVTGPETLVGQGSADLAVRKDFFVDLKVPASLTQGDRPRFSAEVHHRGAAGTLRLRLTAYAGGRESVYPRSIEVKGDGVEVVLFEPIDVPDGDEVRLTLAAALGEARDELTVGVPIRPWGVQAVASASGSAADDATAFVSLPPGREYAEAEMLVVISPTVRRMIVELALGEDAYRLDRRAILCIPRPPDTTADRAGDLLAATSALAYLRRARAEGSPDALRLVDRIRGLAAELISSQNEDGSWPWVAGTSGQARPGDRMTSARVAWALATARALGLMPEPAALEKAATWLAGEAAQAEGGDSETRAALLHALGTLGKAGFEQANALNRARQGLSNAALAHLAMALVDLDRVTLADEVVGLLAARGQSEPVGPGGKPRRYWSGAGQHPWHRSDAETTALVALAFARARPTSPDLAGAVEWLAAHRQGTGWRPARAKGPALAALAGYHGEARAADDRYRLVVTVNDGEVYRVDVAGPTEGAAVRVPRRFLRPTAANRVRFDIEGRGEFAYAVTLTGFTRDFGPDQDVNNKRALVHRRVYWPDNPSVDGRPLSQGFGAAPNMPTWENTVTQAATGGKITVAVEAYRSQPAGLPSWERDFLVLKEYLPAGLTLVEGSVRTEAGHHTFEDGVLTAYFTPDQNLGITYDAFGYLPGRYRALPPSLSAVDEPGRRHLGRPADFGVLGPGEKGTDPYRVTPDELLGRGKYLFEAGRWAEAAPHLKALWGGGYGLRDDVARDAARMLLAISIREYSPRDVVAYFEVLKEKAPDLVLSFDDIRAVGRAYGDLGEHERAFLVWRATTEASYLEDARVGEALRQRGKNLDAVAYLLGLWRDYPSTASIQADFLGLAQVVAGLAARAAADPVIRGELAGAGVTRPDLLLQAIRLDRAFLAQSPRDPLADEASLALVGAFLDLEDFAAVVGLSRRFAGLYPRSTFQDSFQYSEALGRFHLGEHDRAIAVAEAIAGATYKDAAGVDQPSPNKWQALYILGQIHDARRDSARALDYYGRVADRFSDAAGAVKALTRKELKLPEVTVVRPDPDPKPDAPPPSARLEYRNVGEVDLKVYPVDLMRLYLTRRNLDAIAGVDLAGIRPLHSAAIPLGDGRDFDDKSRDVPLPVRKEGAYLVMARGDDRYASGILLVSPLELLVLEEPEAGRVRVTARDARTKAFAPKVQVRVIGSGNPAFFSGETDLRGVFVAEGVVGQVTAVARRGANQYAFHRGTVVVGTPPAATAPTPAARAPADGAEPADLGQNVRGQNLSNQERQLRRLLDRYKDDGKGVKVERAY